jgi:hypothetical protein
LRTFLNVGGGRKEFPLPPQYAGWKHVLLDIDPAVTPDVLCDARKMAQLPGGEYDAVFCSHNLEHYYQHEVGTVLTGFRHVLKADGFAHIVVPDLGQLMVTVTERKLDIEDVLYQSALGPITVRDVIYGYGKDIERRGQDFYAHKTGFTERSLNAALRAADFQSMFMGRGNLEIQALAFMAQPAQYAVDLFGLPKASS